MTKVETLLQSGEETKSESATIKTVVDMLFFPEKSKLWNEKKKKFLLKE